MRLVTSKNRAIQKYLETLSEYSILVQCEARSTKRAAIWSNKIKRSYSRRHTACRVHWESDMHEDQGSVFLSKGESVILKPRVVLKANSQCDSQDLLEQKAGPSGESQQDAESYGETRSNTADYRIPDISISTVKLQDARRQNNVAKLIVMFEKHQHEEQFLKDMSQKQEINRSSEESQAKHQCLDCNAFTEIGIIYCNYGRNLEVLAESYNISEDQLRFYFNRWLCQWEELQSRTKTWCLWKTGDVFQGEADAKESETSLAWKPSDDTFKVVRCSTGRRRCLRKQDSQSTAAIQRFSHDCMHKKDTADHWWSTILAKRKSCISIASLLKVTTTQRRGLNGYRTPNIGFFVRMLVGLKKPPRQQPEFAAALKQCLKMQDAHLAETQQSLRPIRPEHQQRQRQNQQFEGWENFHYYVDRKNWMAVLQRATRKPAGSIFIFIFNFAVTDVAMANDLELVAACIIWEMVVTSVFLEGTPQNRRREEVDRTPTRKYTSVQYSLFTSAERTLNALGLAQVQDQARFASIYVLQRKFSHLVCHMSHPWLFSHAPSSMSTSSSALTYPTTQREHSVHPAHLQAHPVDKRRHQESLWREDLQSGGNPRTTTPTETTVNTSLNKFRKNLQRKQLHNPLKKTLTNPVNNPPTTGETLLIRITCSKSPLLHGNIMKTHETIFHIFEKKNSLLYTRFNTYH